MNRIRLLLLFSLSIVNYQLSIAQNPLVKKWDKRFGGPTADQVWSFQQTKDAGYILGGNSNSGIGGDKTQPIYGAAHGDYDYWVVKIDSIGNKQWDKDFGGTSLDFMYSLQQTSDGGYILGGFSSSGIGGSKTTANVGSQDFWIIKTDALGNEQWEKDFGGTLGDLLYSVQQTKDGGYILGGFSTSGISGDKTQGNWGPSTTADYWIIKTDSLGNKQWDKTFGGTDDDHLYSVRQTKDGGYILGGWSSSGIGGDKTQPTVDSTDYWIVKIDSLGNKQWDKDFGGTGVDHLESVKQTTDGGYILGGFSNSPISGDKTQAAYGQADFWIIKTDSLGTKQWDYIFGGSDFEEEIGSLSQTADGGYLFSGTSYSNISGNKSENDLGTEQTFVVKTNALGIKQWDKTVFTIGHDEIGLSIQTNDGCYAFATYTPAGIGGYKTQPSQGSPSPDFWIVKFCDSTQTILPLADFVSSDTVFCGESGECIDFTDHSTNNPTSWKWYFPGATPDTSTQQNPTSICYYIPGTFAVKLVVSNIYGSDSVTVAPMITFASSAAAPVITFSNDTLFSSHAVSYLWFFNGLPINNATDSFYVVNGDGVYAVQITDTVGCTRLSTGLNVSVNELKGTGGIKIYPNPASQSVVISLLSSVSDHAQITITNVLGAVVYTDRSGPTADLKQPIVLDISSLTKGIYFIEAEDGTRIYRTKFVKQ